MVSSNFSKRKFEKSEGIGRGPLARLMGSFSSAKILDFLSTFREFDYSITEIAENAGLSQRTVQRELPKLREYGVVKIIRYVGRSQMYKLDTDSSITIKLNDLIAAIVEFDTDKIVAAQNKTTEVTEKIDELRPSIFIEEQQ